MGGRGAKSSLTTEQIRQKNQEYMAQMREQGRETLRQSIQQDLENIKPKTNSKEIDAVYDFVEKKGGRYPTIGQNTKAYKYAINNATDITVHDDSDYDYYTGARFNKPATIKDMKQDISRFNMKLNYVGDNTFRLVYYSGLFYTFKLKR